MCEGVTHGYFDCKIVNAENALSISTTTTSALEAERGVGLAKSSNKYSGFNISKYKISKEETSNITDINISV